jgi:signal transduction histidine kinase
MTSFDMKELILQALDTLKSRAEKKSVACAFSCPSATLEADQDKIMQVLINLLDNAIKFTPENGTISVNAEVSEEKIKVNVSDNGIGIHPQDLDIIFHKFKQVSTGIRRTTGGTGLGLVISKTIVEMHGGEIGVSSEVDNGSTFWFTLPLPKVIEAK